ncbi:uncharacterized protein LOC129951179 [Eupeodes corollae]|uniref:uncharacterized protein LOC129951179 n=1 Tax=Eupeodes corollae TaxID=290404 RepID=UPI00248F6935|nr:uncharacterized protein LOC129951179 [Eupeodes corollae]
MFKFEDMQFYKSLVCCLLYIVLCETYCIQEPPRTFHLIKRCQRSEQNMIDFENVDSLEECFKIAKRVKALALNYSPLRGMKSNLFEQNEKNNSNFSFRRRDERRHFFDQPEEFFNCHALQCPESSAFTTMTNDSRFDYYSLYGNPPGPNNFICVPEVGIFSLNFSKENYETAYTFCKNTTNGTLAHVASEKRTIALSKILQDSNFKNGSSKLAYVGLNFTYKHPNGMFKTNENEELSCFLYRAWAPGHPKINGSFANSSCVAVTKEITWMTVDCDQKLPYICEIYTAPLNDSMFYNACDVFLSNEETIVV